MTRITFILYICVNKTAIVPQHFKTLYIMYNKELIERLSTSSKALRLIRKAAKRNVILTANGAAICLIKINF